MAKLTIQQEREMRLGSRRIGPNQNVGVIDGVHLNPSIADVGADNTGGLNHGGEHSPEKEAMLSLFYGKRR
jgi:hypothetical protein